MNKQSALGFTILGTLGGILMGAIGLINLVSTITSGEGAPVVVGIFFLLLGLGLLAGVYWVAKNLLKTNVVSHDMTGITFTMNIGGQTQTLADEGMFRNTLLNMKDDEELLVTVNPAFQGLVSWRFTRKGMYYISFVTLQKKDKCKEYFIVPEKDINEAIAPFLEVFVDHKAVDFTKCIEMKRYEAVLEYMRIQV